ncbi:MAG: TetR family transcriptional regulator [Actinophytocola sp.]|nr:TetR family transcriptional regulator [Actinophytocola sp.]
MAKAGRRPGQTETREQILASARALFAEQGYEGATIRGIAADAGVNPALIHHFFGSKDKVFAASLAIPVDPSVIVSTVATGPRDAAGERLVRIFLTIWGNPDARRPFLALLRSVTSNEAAARMMRQFLRLAIIDRIGPELGVSELRMTAVGTQLMGLAMMRYILQVEPMASADDEEIVAMIAPVIQHHFDA